MIRESNVQPLLILRRRTPGTVTKDLSRCKTPIPHNDRIRPDQRFRVASISLRNIFNAHSRPRQTLAVALSRRWQSRKPLCHQSRVIVAGGESHSYHGSPRASYSASFPRCLGRGADCERQSSRNFQRLLARNDKRTATSIAPPIKLYILIMKHCLPPKMFQPRTTS